jgi:hypothetical protein
MKKKKKARAKATKKTKARKVVKSKVKKTSAKRPPTKAAKKSKAKKTKKTAAPPKPGVIAPVNGVLMGFVEDYFAKIGVIALTLKSPIALGQKMQVLGHTTNFEQTVGSMQINHAPVAQAGVNDSVGIKVNNRARAGDHVYLLK